MTTKSPMLCKTDIERLDDFYKQVQTDSDLCIGFPWNSLFDYSPLYRFLSYPINNDGDPYSESGYRLNSHEFEREALDIFSQLTEAPAGSTWGYINSGGTEGNIYGITLARELYPDGIFYCSEETFAMHKLLRCLRVRTSVVRSHDDGTINLDHLRELIEPNRHLPAIILANIGTTMKGAVDDVNGIRNLLDSLSIEERYIHADAALSGMVLPFVDNAPPWNFAAGVDSISISLHKMLGSPLPCGVVLAKQTRVDQVACTTDGGGRLDTTILASRNAITPLFVWYAFRTIGLEGFRQRIQECFPVADYAIERLSDIGWSSWRHPYSNTVVFKSPSDRIVKKWQLFAQGDTAHLITMPHVTRERIDLFVDDLSNETEPSEKELVESAS